MPLRVIGDVHSQLSADDLAKRGVRPYLAIIADVEHSVQLGDLGDEESYARLLAEVDPVRHRFFPGNHERYDRFPPHCLGDFGLARVGGVEFFFVRGASSADRDKLLVLGQKLGKTLWWEQEELSEAQMREAEERYLAAKPIIVISHDAPGEIARFAWQHARTRSPAAPGAVFRPSRTNVFLDRLLSLHRPRLWLFGHHHHNWSYVEFDTRFVCVGELAFVDIDAQGEIIGSSKPIS